MPTASQKRINHFLLSQLCIFQSAGKPFLTCQWFPGIKAAFPGNNCWQGACGLGRCQRGRRRRQGRSRGEGDGGDEEIEAVKSEGWESPGARHSFCFDCCRWLFYTIRVFLLFHVFSLLLGGTLTYTTIYKCIFVYMYIYVGVGTYTYMQ